MSKAKNDITEVKRTDDKDLFLQKLVGFSNIGPMSFGITLNIGGFLVSGMSINREEYFESLGSDFVDGIVNGADNTELAKFKDDFVEYGKTNDEKLSPDYIHIKKAKFFSTNGDPISGGEGVLWRGCISKVDGFSLGCIGIASE